MKDYRQLAIKLNDGRIVCGLLQGNGGILGNSVTPIRNFDEMRAYVVKRFKDIVRLINKGRGDHVIYLDDKGRAKLYTHGYEDLDIPGPKIPHLMIDLKGATLLKKIPDRKKYNVKR